MRVAGAREAGKTARWERSKHARDGCACRRAALLDFFGERPAPFGERCGTCDNCVALAAAGDALAETRLNRIIMAPVLTDKGFDETRCRTDGMKEGARNK